MGNWNGETKWLSRSFNKDPEAEEGPARRLAVCQAAATTTWQEKQAQVGGDGGNAECIIFLFISHISNSINCPDQKGWGKLIKTKLLLLLFFLYVLDHIMSTTA